MVFFYKGLAMEGHLVHMGSCKCQKHTSTAFGPKQIQSIQVIPKGIQCGRTEIILTLKSKWQVCVAPTAQWVQKLLKRLIKSLKKKVAPRFIEKNLVTII
uniref:Chemokine interleukin-8-like domain-containing protein n=1 Tax=Podarcis muralis TaxID=64176 RepID=A0A670KI92_PODMU